MYSKSDSSRQIRLGLLVPAGNTTFEPDFHCAFSSQVSVHSHRVIAQRSHASENYESMDDINEEAAKEIEKLARAGIHFGAYGFTTATFYRGRVFAEKLEQRLTQMVGVPVIVPALALLEALTYLKIRKISVVTPYPEWNNQTLKTFLSEASFEIVGFKGDERPKEIAKNNYLCFGISYPMKPQLSSKRDLTKVQMLLCCPVRHGEHLK